MTDVDATKIFFSVLTTIFIIAGVLFYALPSAKPISTRERIDVSRIGDVTCFTLIYGSDVALSCIPDKAELTK